MTLLTFKQKYISIDGAVSICDKYNMINWFTSVSLIVYLLSIYVYIFTPLGVVIIIIIIIILLPYI